MKSSTFRSATLLLCAAFFIVGCDSEQQTKPKASPELTVRSSGAAPADADCIVVLLHGYGAPGDDLMSLAEHLDTTGQAAFLFPEGPIDLEHGGRAWNIPGGEGFDESRTQVAKLLQRLAKDHPDCPLIVGGFSQGATMSANLLDTTECPTLKAAILFAPANLFRLPPPKDQTHPRVLISHGRNDPVLTFSDAEELRNQIESLGIDVTWAPFDGPHTIAAEGLVAAQELLQSIRDGESEGRGE